MYTSTAMMYSVVHWYEGCLQIYMQHVPGDWIG